MKKYKEAILYAFLIILGFVYVIAKIKPEIGGVLRAENSIKEKTVQVEDLQRQLDTFKKAESDKAASDMEKTSLSQQVKNIYKPETSGLEAESSFTVIFDDIIDMAKYNGIKIYSIEYVYNPKEDEFVTGAADQYNVCQLNMQIVTDYQDLESFLRELYKYPYLINIDKIELTPYPKNKKILLSNLQLKLYSAK
jgi:Tfp pilus assembly protein PilO